MAPLASNRNEAGRAQNRRVELGEFLASPMTFPALLSRNPISCVIVYWESIEKKKQGQVWLFSMTAGNSNIKPRKL